MPAKHRVITPPVTLFGSPAWRMTADDWGKIAKGALVAACGAAAAGMASYAAHLDASSYVGIVGSALAGVAANVLRKFATDTRE